MVNDAWGNGGSCPPVREAESLRETQLTPNPFQTTELSREKPSGILLVLLLIVP